MLRTYCASVNPTYTCQPCLCRSNIVSSFPKAPSWYFPIVVLCRRIILHLCFLKRAVETWPGLINVIYPIHRKAQDLVLVLEADQDQKTVHIPGLVHDRTTAALSQHHAPNHDLDHHDATDHTPSHPGIQGPGPVQSHDLDQNPHRSQGLDHALALLLNHQEMRKLALQNVKQTRIKITIRQMLTLRCSKLNSLLRLVNSVLRFARKKLVSSNLFMYNIFRLCLDSMFF